MIWGCLALSVLLLLQAGQSVHCMELAGIHESAAVCVVLSLFSAWAMSGALLFVRASKINRASVRKSIAVTVAASIEFATLFLLCSGYSAFQ